MNTIKKCNYAGCQEPVWSESNNGLCLFHDPDNGKDEESARKVWERVEEKLDAKDGNFEGWHFPHFVGLDFGFAGRTIEHRLLLSDSVFDCDAYFCNLAISDDTSFSHAHFCRELNLRETTFEGNADFVQMTAEKSVAIESATFKDVSFHRAVFEGYVGFYDTTVHGHFNCTDAQFRNGMRIDNCVYNDLFDLWGSAVYGETFFLEDKFNRDASFVGTKFRGEFCMAECQFSREWPIILDLPARDRSSGEGVPFKRPGDGIGLYRAAKNTAHSTGDYTMEGEYHFAEQCAIDAAKANRFSFRLWEWAWNPFDVWRFVKAVSRYFFGRLVFGYGEKPIRAALWGLFVILLWAGQCYNQSGITDDTAGYVTSFRDALHFSVVTFTTLGYGDFQPLPHFRFWADVEALLGAGLMATFIVGLTRKYTR